MTSETLESKLASDEGKRIAREASQLFRDKLGLAPLAIDESTPAYRATGRKAG